MFEGLTSQCALPVAMAGCGWLLRDGRITAIDDRGFMGGCAWHYWGFGWCNAD